MDYKKYSLDKLNEWLHDLLGVAEASPQEIYDKIKEVVEETYYYHKNETAKCYELLSLLNGNGKGHIQAYDDYLNTNSNLTCDKNDPSPECQKSWNSFWEENYYPEEVKDDKVKKWQLPVEIDAASDEYFVCFPDDLLEAANLKEGDQVEWVSNGDGSHLLKKVENPTDNVFKM